MDSFIIGGIEADLSLLFDGLFQYLELVFEEDPFPLVLRKKRIGGEEVPEVAGDGLIAYQDVFYETESRRR